MALAIDSKDMGKIRVKNTIILSFLSVIILTVSYACSKEPIFHSNSNEKKIVDLEIERIRFHPPTFDTDIPVKSIMTISLNRPLRQSDLENTIYLIDSNGDSIGLNYSLSKGSVDIMASVLGGLRQNSAHKLIIESKPADNQIEPGGISEYLFKSGVQDLSILKSTSKLSSPNSVAESYLNQTKAHPKLIPDIDVSIDELYKDLELIRIKAEESVGSMEIASVMKGDGQS